MACADTMLQNVYGRIILRGKKRKAPTSLQVVFPPFINRKHKMNRHKYHDLILHKQNVTGYLQAGMYLQKSMARLFNLLVLILVSISLVSCFFVF